MQLNFIRVYLILASILGVASILRQALIIINPDLFIWVLVVLLIMQWVIAIPLWFILSPMCIVYVCLTKRNKLLLIPPISYLVFFFVSLLSVILFEETAFITLIDQFIDSLIHVVVIWLTIYAFKNEKFLDPVKSKRKKKPSV